MYERKIIKLNENLDQLKKELEVAKSSYAHDEVTSEIKKKKLAIKDQIRELTMLDNAGCEFK